MTAPAFRACCRYCASIEGDTEGVRQESFVCRPRDYGEREVELPCFYCHGWFAIISSHKPTQIDMEFFCVPKVRANGVRSERLSTIPSAC